MVLKPVFPVTSGPNATLDRDPVAPGEQRNFVDEELFVAVDILAKFVVGVVYCELKKIGVLPQKRLTPCVASELVCC